MMASEIRKSLVPSFMFPSIKEEDARAVYRAALRVQKGILCTFNELLFTDLQRISKKISFFLRNGAK